MPPLKAPKVLQHTERQLEVSAVAHSFCLDLATSSTAWLSPHGATGTCFEPVFLSQDLPLPGLLCGVRAQPLSSCLGALAPGNSCKEIAEGIERRGRKRSEFFFSKYNDTNAVCSVKNSSGGNLPFSCLLSALAFLPVSAFWGSA